MYNNNAEWSMKMGNLVKTPTIKTVMVQGQPKKVCDVVFAHNYKTYAGNDARTFHEFSLWGKKADLAEQMIASGKFVKGTLVKVQGQESKKVSFANGRKYVTNIFQNTTVQIYDENAEDRWPTI